MPKRHTSRGLAVERSFQEPAGGDVEGGRLRNLSIAQDTLVKYALQITGPYICSVVLIFSLVIPLVMIIMGCVYYNDCPAEDHIPKYLIVAGASCLIYIIGRYLTPPLQRGYFSILFLFLICWFITGSVWIFSAFEPNYHKNSTDLYCDKTLYLFAVWITVGEYMMSGTMIIYLCILCYLALPMDD